ncbi:fibroblast growth factor receptor-like 1 [Oratosquilla oratoria]|uniref:fibroblast growth factor receptor-like 1 n=1 Tax=Oratosquilla oratoria TaxID=337810 RepID=UPI003F760E90
MVTIHARTVLEMLVTVVGVGLLVLTPTCRSSGVKGPPRVNGSGNEQRVVRAGETVKLPCPITASPDPLFEWKKDNEPVDDMWTRFVSRRHSLKIKGVVEADSGMYTCKGVNGFGQATATIQLIVLDKSVTDASPNPRAPVLTQVTEVTGSALEKEVGESLVLRCQSDALPKATVTWYKDDVAIGAQGVVYQQEYVKSLDTGVYTCVAKNVLGSANASFAIRVVEPSRTTAPMLAILEPVNTTVQLGETAILRCTVKADQRSMVEWMREISPLEAAGHNGTVTYNKRHFRVLRSGATVDRGDGTFLSTYKIAQASPRDAGIYICLGIRGDGYSLKEAHVTVVRAPPAVPPHDVKRPGQLNWLLLIIPAAAVAAIVVVVIVYQLRRGGATKPSKDENVVGVTRPPTLTSAKGLDETSVLAPLNPDSRAFMDPHKPDLVYQEPVYHQVSGCGSSLPSYHGYPHSERSVPEAVYPPNSAYPTPATSLRYAPASQYREQCRDRKGSDHYGGSHRVAADHNHSRLPYGSTGGGGACSGASTTSTAHTPFHAHTHPHQLPHQQYFVQYDL